MAVAARRRAAAPPPRGTTASEIQTVDAAAKSHGIPFWTLWGVFGAESSWGKGGTNWFGLTAVPRTGSFAGDANASAATLATLYGQHGRNWDKALRAYSGNSYGEDHVAKLVESSSGGGVLGKGEKPVEPLGLVDPKLGKEAAGAIPGPGAILPALPNWFGAVGKLVLEGVLLLAGAVLVIYGIMVAVRPRDRAFSIPTP